MAQRGNRVTLVDKSAECRPCFKAEKLEPDQISLLQRHGLMDGLQSALTPIHGVTTFRGSRIVKTSGVHQFGMRYESLVNTLLAQMPAAVQFVKAEVVGVAATDQAGSVSLRGGRVLDADLVVLAAGSASRLAVQSGLKRHEISRNNTVVFGFDFAISAERLPFEGVNFWPAFTNPARVGYLTLFPVTGGLRANLFAYADPRGEWTAALRAQPDRVLREVFAGLDQVLPGFHVTSRVEAVNIDLWTSEPVPSRLVAVGDAFQSVCPSTGTGLSKVLTDVTALVDALDAGLPAGRPIAQIVDDYYSSDIKQRVDRNSLLAARHGRIIAADRGLEGWYRRFGREIKGTLRRSRA
jgi:2-polyprenyl-6-methoxyphenol hydroxylase-like FAD-dependent oxidoreductase